MNAPVNARTFKSGNSVSMRLPKRLGMEPNQVFAVNYDGDNFYGRRVPTVEEEARRFQRFRNMLETLQRIGPVGEIQERDPFEFPDRPGL